MSWVFQNNRNGSLDACESHAIDAKLNTPGIKEMDYSTYYNYTSVCE